MQFEDIFAKMRVNIVYKINYDGSKIKSKPRKTKKYKKNKKTLKFLLKKILICDILYILII